MRSPWLQRARAWVQAVDAGPPRQWRSLQVGLRRAEAEGAGLAALERSSLAESAEDVAEAGAASPLGDAHGAAGDEDERPVGEGSLVFRL